MITEYLEQAEASAWQFGLDHASAQHVKRRLDSSLGASPGPDSTIPVPGLDSTLGASSGPDCTTAVPGLDSALGASPGPDSTTPVPGLDSTLGASSVPDSTIKSKRISDSAKVSPKRVKRCARLPSTSEAATPEPSNTPKRKAASAAASLSQAPRDEVGAGNRAGNKRLKHTPTSVSEDESTETDVKDVLAALRSEVVLLKKAAKREQQLFAQENARRACPGPQGASAG